MRISLSEVSKRYNRDWIFRKFSYNFSSNNGYAITGPNGSGKSTLLQVISGATAMSEGDISYDLKSEHEAGDEKNVTTISPENFFKYLSIAAPYLEVIEEMSATEFLQFHHKFKPLSAQHSIQEMLSVIGLGTAAHKQIRYFSSGMKQRIKLAQAIFSNTPILLLDEPCTNLDDEGIRLYHQLIEKYCQGRLIIISSNDPQEFDFCKHRISILDYK